MNNNIKNFMIVFAMIAICLFTIADVSATWVTNRAVTSGGALIIVNSTVNYTSNYYSINLTNNYTVYNNTAFWYNITNNITVNNTYFGANVTNNITTPMNYTNLALTNQSTSWGVFNVTANWFLGKFNWTALGAWFGWNGYELSFNGTLLNDTINQVGVNAGFNNTYNATYHTTTSTWNGNSSLLIGALNNASYLSTYNITYETTTNTWNGNSSLLLGALNNASYLSTYNVTYDTTTKSWDGNYSLLVGALNNASYLSTYNVTYHNGVAEWKLNETAYGKYWYNHTSAANNYSDAMLITTYYNATQSGFITGTLDAGTLTNTQHSDAKYDGRTMNISEAAGAPGLDARINFTGITTFTSGVMRYYTGAIAGTAPIIQLWDYTTSTWENYPATGQSRGFNTITQPVFDSADHVSGGVVQMRIYKASNGNVNNHYYIDWIAIAKGPGVPAGSEVDPYSYHTGQNLDSTGWNITASWFFGRYNWTALGNFLGFDGSSLTFNGTLLNETISQVGVNVGFNNTYNISYQGLIQNASYLSTYNITYHETWVSLNNNYTTFTVTYNATYDAITQEWRANQTAFGKWWYNHTVDANAYTDATNVSMTNWIDAIFLKIADMFDMATIVQMIGLNRTAMETEMQDWVDGNRTGAELSIVAQVGGNVTNLTTYINTRDAINDSHRHSISNLTAGTLGVNLNMSYTNITNTNYIRFQKISGACDLTTNGSICSNSTGTYIVG